MDESGARITGGSATAGNREASIASRSPTNCRDSIRSVPSWNISTMDDKPQHRFRANGLQVGRTVQCVLQRYRHQALNFLGRKARSLRLDLDQRWREFGKHVQRRVSQILIADATASRRPRRGPGTAAATMFGRWLCSISDQLQTQCRTIRPPRLSPPQRPGGGQRRGPRYRRPRTQPIRVAAHTRTAKCS